MERGYFMSCLALYVLTLRTHRHIPDIIRCEDVRYIGKVVIALLG